jgi:hypothetical protein
MRKNIYIRDEDQAMFDKAEALFGDNFSGLIAESVKRFVEVEESKASGLTEQEVEVGTYYSGPASDDVKTIKFVGRLIADAEAYTGQTSERKDRGTDYKLYLTKKGKYLLHAKYWTCWQGEDGQAWYKVYDSLSQAASDDIPGSLIQEAGEALGMDTAEYLDV